MLTGPARAGCHRGSFARDPERVHQERDLMELFQTFLKPLCEEMLKKKNISGRGRKGYQYGDLLRIGSCKRHR